MKVRGDKLLSSSPKVVWSALHDPDTLSRAIPGGGKVQQIETGTFSVAVEASVMGMKATYEGEVRFTYEVPESHCKVSVSGEGPLGPVSGKGDLRLLESGEGTLVNYDFEVDVGGGMGFLGGAVMGGVAKKMVERFLEGVDAGSCSASDNK